MEYNVEATSVFWWTGLPEIEQQLAAGKPCSVRDQGTVRAANGASLNQETLWLASMSGLTKERRIVVLTKTPKELCSRNDEQSAKVRALQIIPIL